MARFIGSVQGNRGEATRLGSKNSDMTIYANGWEFGVYARLFYDEDTKQDMVNIYINNGSKGERRVKHIGTFSKQDLRAK